MNAGVSETAATDLIADWLWHNKKLLNVTELEQHALGVRRHH